MTTEIPKREKPVFRFAGEYVSQDPTGYAVTRWDRATPVSVLASTRQEAYQKLWTMLGDAPRGRRWTARWNKIDEAADR